MISIRKLPKPKLGKLVRRLGRLLGWLQRNQTLIIILSLTATTYVLAYASGFWIFFRAAYLLTGLICLSFIWARANLRGLKVQVERLPPQVQVGQEAETRVELRSLSPYPKLWLEVEDKADMPGPPAKRVISLAAHGYRSWSMNRLCRRRGLFTVGPLAITSGDPFGLFRFERSFGVAHSLIVYPLPVDLPYFHSPPAQLSGESRQRQRTHYVTPNAASVRDYQPGDGLNRIHWRTTARLARLMVKTFELDQSSHIWVILDLQEAVQAGQDEESTEEYGVQIACSVARHFLAANRTVGYVSYGQQVALLEPSRGMQQYMRILEALALARAKGDVPLWRLLGEEAKRFGRHSTLVVVTPSVEESWVTALQSLIQQGVKAAVVLLEGSSFGQRETPLLPYSTLLASGILTYLVRQGDDISLALGPAGAADLSYWTEPSLLKGSQ